MINETLDSRLKKESERSGVPKSEIARRALNDYLYTLESREDNHDWDQERESMQTTSPTLFGGD